MKKLQFFAMTWALLFCAAQADTIILKGKPALTGVKVMVENLKEVEYIKGAAKRRQKVPSGEVLGIVYDKQPRDFRKGVEYFNLGDFVNATSRLETAAKSDDKTPWLKEYAYLYLGRAYLAGGQFSKGVQSFQKVISVKSDTRWLPLVTAGLVRCHIAGKQYGKAETAVNSFKTAVKTKSIPGFWGAEADLLLGESQIAAGQYDKAVETLRGVARAVQNKIASDTTAKSIHVRAKRMQGQAHIEAGEVKKAELMFDELKKQARGGNQYAQAAWRTGQAAVILASKTADSDELVKAAHELTRANVENFVVVSEMPRTCYLLGLVHLRLKGTLSNAQGLAKGYFEETRRRFPETREALLARDELKKM